MPDLNDDNFLILAAKAYDKPLTLSSEFESDLKRFRYLKRLIRKYKNNNDLKERLILNHIIILGNVFGIELAVKMLFLKIESCDYDVLKTFLVYLRYLPSEVHVNGKKIITSEIPLNQNIVEVLRKI